MDNFTTRFMLLYIYASVGKPVQNSGHIMMMAIMFTLVSFVYLNFVPNIDPTNVKRTSLQLVQRQNKSDTNIRIFDGRDVTDEEYPYVIVLIISDNDYSLSTRECAQVP